MLVAHPLDVDGEARAGAEALCQPAGVGVVVGEALDVVVERVDAGRRDDARLPHAAAEQLAHRLARPTSSAVPAMIDPTGAPSPFERQNWTVSTSRQMTSAPTPSATAALNRRAPSMCTFIPRACA